MTSRTHVAALVLAVATVVALAGCASEATTDAEPATVVESGPAEPTTPAPATSSEPTTATPEAASEGSYIDYATYTADPQAYADTDVVLFFHAEWCPFCRDADERISSEPVPAGLTIVKTDFDTETDLRREHGVTVQHTFVQVGPDGAAVKKWSGSESAADIVAQLA